MASSGRNLSCVVTTLEWYPFARMFATLEGIRIHRMAKVDDVTRYVVGM